MSEQEKKEEQRESSTAEEPKGQNVGEGSSKPEPTGEAVAQEAVAQEEEQPAMMLLREIAQIMKEMNLSEVTYEEEGIKLSLKHGVTVQATPQQTLTQLPASQNGTLVPIEGSVVTDELVAIGAFMLGIFYSAPVPGEEPYVKVGDRVSEGEPLCVIVVMKHLNEQKAEFDCEIVEILVEDAEPVQYDTPLFKVRRTS